MLVLLLIGMICFSQTAARGVMAGLLLWYQAVLPTLFPCSVVTTMLLRRQSILPLVRILQPVFGALFGLSPAGTYVFVCSMFCGYPCAAVLTGQMYEAGRLSEEELHHILAFANLPGPAFLSGFLLKTCFPDCGIPVWALFGIYVIAAMGMAWMHRLLHPQKRSEKQEKILMLPSGQRNLPFFEDLNISIHQALEIQLNICGCLLFASAIAALASELLKTIFGDLDSLLSGIGIGLLEMTSGIRLLSESNHPAALPGACGIAAFGGFSVAAQVFSTLPDRKKTRYSLAEYLVWKVLYGLLVTAIAALARFTLLLS